MTLLIFQEPNDLHIADENTCVDEMLRIIGDSANDNPRDWFQFLVDDDELSFGIDTPNAYYYVTLPHTKASEFLNALKLFFGSTKRFNFLRDYGAGQSAIDFIRDNQSVSRKRFVYPEIRNYAAWRLQMIDLLRPLPIEHARFNYYIMIEE